MQLRSNNGIVDPRAEQSIVVLALTAVAAAAAYRSILWIAHAPRTPDPWEPAVDDATNSAEATPLCHHCLTPQEHNGWFCPECGATFGAYVNYMPFVCIFSQGEILRAGVNERFRRSSVIKLGFILYAVAEYAVLAPVYLYLLFRNLRHSETRPEQLESQSPS